MEIEGEGDPIVNLCMCSNPINLLDDCGEGEN